MTASLTVTAPTRLHFGLLSFGNTGRQFGGTGVMLETPRLQLTICKADKFSALGQGNLPQRVSEFAGRWAQHHQRLLPNCEVEIVDCPAQHVGLGVGTQLGLAVAAGLSAWVDLPRQNAVELGTSVGRGLRSAVGTYGFVGGGFIVERGKLKEPISPLDCQIDVPPQWRFVLIRPQVKCSVWGAEEQSNFDQLPPVTEETTNRLVDILKHKVVPGVATDDFDLFSAGLYSYGQIAGNCFTSIQGGPYNGVQITKVVETVRQLGIEGVGQSSWGPTVFAVTRNQDAAGELSEKLRELLREFPVEIHISSPANHGAIITDARKPVSPATRKSQ
ncbi:MAG: beta-ribofuranosylaminobenzene 5'-phosphate synthase [Pirellulaceae bacterium]|jgi:beta-ribofuranosylaminobenzene 5'-phosphate synthase